MKNPADILRDMRPWLVLGNLFLWGAVAFLPGLAAPFYFDDFPRILDNPLVKHLNADFLWRFDPGRFLTYLSFALNYSVAGLDVHLWRWVNILIHLGSGYFVFQWTLLTCRTPRGKQIPAAARHPFAVAALTAGFFLLHPAQTQAVVYIVQRATLLAGFCLFGCLFFYTRARLDADDKDYLRALAFAAAGAFCKPTFVVLPLAVLLYDLCFWGYEKRSSMKRALVFLGLSLPALIVLVFSLSSGEFQSAVRDAYVFRGGASQALSALAGLSFGLRVILAPVGLALDYDIIVPQRWTEGAAIFSGAVLVLMGLIAALSARKMVAVTFGILWFLIVFWVPHSLFPLADIFYDHWLYPGVFAFGLLAALGIWSLKTSPGLRTAAGVLILAVFLGMTAQRSALWADPVAFGQNEVARSPFKPRVRNNLGYTYLTLGRVEEAERAFREVLALDPRHMGARNNLARVAIFKKKDDEAARLLQEIIKEQPSFSTAYLNLAQLFLSQDRYEEAYGHFSRAVQLNPYDFHSHLGLGNLLDQMGDLPAAKAELEKALWLNPDSAAAYYNLGNVNMKLKNLYDAMVNYEEALRRRPVFPEALNNLGQLFFYFQDYKGARQKFEQVIAQAPQDPDGHFNLANTLYEMGEKDLARQSAVKAVELYRKTGREDRADLIQSKIDESPR